MSILCCSSTSIIIPTLFKVSLYLQSTLFMYLLGGTYVGIIGKARYDYKSPLTRTALLLFRKRLQKQTIADFTHPCCNQQVNIIGLFLAGLCLINSCRGPHKV